MHWPRFLSSCLLVKEVAVENVIFFHHIPMLCDNTLFVSLGWLLFIDLLT